MRCKTIHDTLSGIGLMNSGVAEFERHVKATVKMLQSCDALFGGRVGQTENIATQLFQLGPLVVDQFAQ